ncbi:MAG: HPr family phosphocarrier protein [Planctomycetota bacterium]|jgi:phosphotransferase system HPr (HPr) family protein|nr:HPr family phosphocarrier protein [Planctomycetota bacterium]
MSDTAKRTVTVRHKYGIHARPAAQIMALGSTFASDIRIIKTGEPPANAKSVLDIMMLAAAPGVKLEITAAGPDAQAAVSQLGNMLESDFDTD